MRLQRKHHAVCYDMHSQLIINIFACILLSANFTFGLLFKSCLISTCCLTMGMGGSTLYLRICSLYCSGQEVHFSPCEGYASFANNWNKARVSLKVYRQNLQLLKATASNELLVVMYQFSPRQ